MHLREFRARLGLSTAEVARQADLPTGRLVDAGLGIIESTMIELCAVLCILTVRHPGGQRAVMNASRHDIEAWLGGQWDQDAAAELVERIQAAGSDIEAEWVRVCTDFDGAQDGQDVILDAAARDCDRAACKAMTAPRGVGLRGPTTTGST